MSPAEMLRPLEVDSAEDSGEGEFPTREQPGARASLNVGKRGDMFWKKSEPRGSLSQ